MYFAGCLVALYLLAVSAAHGTEVIFRETFEKGLSENWKPVKFEGLTEYKVVNDGTNSFLRARANQSASGIAHEIPKEVEGGAIFSWKWMIDKIPEKGSERDIKTFDHTARVFVAFKTFLGPPRTINYVWGNKEDSGTTFHHPNSGRSRMIVLQAGNEKANRWVQEKRDLKADWKLLFGEDEVPEIVGIGVITDSDGTKTQITGGYDDLVLFKP